MTDKEELRISTKRRLRATMPKVHPSTKGSMTSTSPPPRRRGRDERPRSQPRTRRPPPPLDTSRSEENEEFDSNDQKHHYRHPYSAGMESEITFTSSSASTDNRSVEGYENRDNNCKRRGEENVFESVQGKRDGVATSLASNAENGEKVENDIGVVRRSAIVDDEERRRHQNIDEMGESTESSTVFNFSGIRATRSNELMVNGERAIEAADLEFSPSDPSLESQEFNRLLVEVERIFESIPRTDMETPKATNKSRAIPLSKSYSRSLTSIHSGEHGELAHGMHATIMRRIVAMMTNTSLREKEAIVRDLFKMGIRVATGSSIRQQEYQAIHPEMNAEPSETFQDRQQTIKIASPSKGVSYEYDSETRESLSSRNIDERWEILRTKFLQETPNSSSEVDGRWEMLRDRALNDDEESSPDGLTSEMEEDLIRDCVETGMPSPTRTQTRGGGHEISTRRGKDRDSENGKSLSPPVADALSRQELHSKDGHQTTKLIQNSLLDCDMNDGSSSTVDIPNIPMMHRRGQPDEDEDIQQPFLRRAQQEDDFDDTYQPSSPRLVVRRPAPSITSFEKTSFNANTEAKKDSSRNIDANVKVPVLEGNQRANVQENTYCSETEHLHEEIPTSFEKPFFNADTKSKEAGSGHIDESIQLPVLERIQRQNVQEIADGSEVEYLHEEMDEHILNSGSDIDDKKPHDASDDTVSSCLTGDGEGQRIPRALSSFSDTVSVDKPMRLSNCSLTGNSMTTDAQNSHHHQKVPFLQRLLSSASTSCSIASNEVRMFRKEHFCQEKASPPKIKESFEESMQCPRIEVTLVPSSSYEISRKSDASSENSEKELTDRYEEESRESATSIEKLSMKKDTSVDSSKYRPKASLSEGGGENNSYGDDNVVKKLFITGRKEIMSDHCDDSIESIDRHETDILQISSSLTGGTDSKSNKCERDKSKSEDSKPVLRKSTKGSKYDDSSHPIELSVGHASHKSFESRKSVTPNGVPAWRLAPSANFSDFTLQIVNEKTGESMEYSIHKHMAAVGIRKSEYLEERFRTESSHEFQVALDEKPAKLVPNLLDYIYCHDYDIDVNTENVIALRQLGKIFKVVPLVVKVAGFILEDMTIGNLSAYVSESSLYKDEKVKKVIVSKCSQNIHLIAIGDPVWAVMEPPLFLEIVSSPFIEREALSAQLSLLVKEYIEMHRYEINVNMFTALTSEMIIPTLDREAALPLIELCEAFDSAKDCEALQKRCAFTVACYWKTTSHEDRHRLFALLRNLPSSFTVDFLEIVDSGNVGAKTQPPRYPISHERTSDIDHEREIPKAESMSLADLCDDLAGEDGYSVSGGCDDILSWRLTPEQSFSDWSIRVKHSGHKRGDVYHVHKHVMSIGLHRSEFFADLFRSKDACTEGHGNTTIELDHQAAMVFPNMLDFIYSPDHDVNITHSSAVALRFVARVFEVSTLSTKVLEFVSTYISLSNVSGYIEGADAFEDDKVKAIAARLCTRDILCIDIDSHLLVEIKPDFFAKVVASSEIDQSARCHVAILITKYFSLHNLDETILGELLSHVDVPLIDPLSALKLLKILSGLKKSQEIDILDQMQRRCANVLTEHWNELRDNHREEMFSLFPSLHPKLLTDIFDVVDHQYKVQHYESVSMQSRLVKRYRAQVAEANNLREQEVSVLRQELEYRTAEMLSTQKTLETKLGKVNDSLNRRTVRSSAAFGNQLPNVQMNKNSNSDYNASVTRYSQIPTIRSISPGKSTVDVYVSAREYDTATSMRVAPPEEDEHSHGTSEGIDRSNHRPASRSYDRTIPPTQQPSHASLAEGTQQVRDFRKQEGRTDDEAEPVGAISGVPASSPPSLGSFFHWPGGGCDDA